MNKDTLRQFSIVVAVVATIVVNALADALPINGRQTGAISDMFQVYFVPAGYVFSIWGLIYLALIAYAVYQALPAQRTNPRLRSIGALFLAGSAANIAWIFLWHYLEFAATMVAMLVLLLTLIGIYLRLDAGRSGLS
ncbi:MAG TPA: tryptophan-rich sensory protein, partial [Anaerolineae bacterium]